MKNKKKKVKERIRFTDLEWNLKGCGFMDLFFKRIEGTEVKVQLKRDFDAMRKKYEKKVKAKEMSLEEKNEIFKNLAKEFDAEVMKRFQLDVNTMDRHFILTK